MKLTSKSGFTLAEVLITLGIIGVVAAMTMPTLMNQTNGAQYKTAYKKALSAISQAVTLNVALDEWSFADATETDTTKDLSIYSMLNKRMNVVKTATSTTDAGYSSFPSSIKAKYCAETTGEGAAAVTTYRICTAEDGETQEVDVPAPNMFITFNDGITFAYKNDSGNATKCTNISTDNTNKFCLGIIDVNGSKNPNKVVTCQGSNDQNKDGCVVSNPTDIYPVVFYDQSILPASDAASAVLYSK